MHIEMRDIDSVRPYPGNPRLNDAAVDAVAASIRAFGFRQAIVTDAEGVIVVGHTRWRAARKLGLKKVPVHVASDLTEAELRGYRLADNKTHEFAQWDYDLLPIEIGALREMHFDLSVLGFNVDELAEIMAVSTHGEDPDVVPEPPGEPKSKRGELYALGRHRLLVGDATCETNVQRVMCGQQAHLLLTDPPYGVSYVGKTKDALTIENDRIGDEQTFQTFLASAFRCADSVMRAGAAFYVWHADSEGFTFRAACRDVGWKVRQCLVWAKSSMVLGRQDYQWRHEPCLYGWKDGAAHQWLSDRSQTTLLEFDRPSRSAEHPTMKPVALFAYQMANSTRKGQRVLDLFAGSGTTVIAAEQTGRTAHVLELDARYADVVIQRWESFAGKKAELLESAEPVVLDERTPTVEAGVREGSDAA